MKKKHSVGDRVIITYKPKTYRYCTGTIKLSNGLYYTVLLENPIMPHRPSALLLSDIEFTKYCHYKLQQYQKYFQ